MTISLNLASQISFLETQVTQNENSGLPLEAALHYKYKKQIEELQRHDLLDIQSKRLIASKLESVTTNSISGADLHAISKSDMEKFKQFSKRFAVYGSIMLGLSALSLLTNLSAFTLACILFTFTIGFTFLYAISTATPSVMKIKPAVAMYGIISAFSLAILSLIIMVINWF